MPKALVGLTSGGQVGKILFDTQNVYATGGPDFPRLGFVLDLHLSPLRTVSPGEQTQQPHPLTWMFLTAELSSPEQRVVSKVRQDVNVYADGSYALETQLRLEVPLDLMTLERIEQARDGNLRAALKIDGFIAVHVPNKSCITRFETTTIEQMIFAVPKSHWVEQLLPQLGYGRLELIEVRISTGALPGGIPKAVAEIRQARAYLNDGDWEKAAAHCRNTLETILDSRPLQLPTGSKFSMRVDTFIQDHLSSNLGGKQSKLLADEMKLLWEVCSKAAHPSPADYFKREDAVFIIRNTTAILEYISKILA
jgi:hypothetical protein